MQIPVNKDIDDYKDDFFKGMTLKQTAMCALTVTVGSAVFFLCSVVLKLPQTVSTYLVFPAALPFAAAGFWKQDNMSIAEYIKKRREVARVPVYRYRPLLFGMPEEDTGSGPKKSRPEDGTKKRAGKKDRKCLLGPNEEMEVVSP